VNAAGGSVVGTMPEQRPSARKGSPRPTPWRPYIAAFALTGAAWVLEFHGGGYVFPCLLAVAGFGFAVVGAKRYTVGVGFNTRKPMGLLATVVIGAGNLILFYALVGLFLGLLTPARIVTRFF